MADEPQFENVQLVGRRVPDTQRNVDADGNVEHTPLPGTFEVGFFVGKTFHALATMHAGNLFNADGSHVRPADKSDESAQASESDPHADAVQSLSDRLAAVEATQSQSAQAGETQSENQPPQGGESQA